MKKAKQVMNKTFIIMMVMVLVFSELMWVVNMPPLAIGIFVVLGILVALYITWLIKSIDKDK